MLQHAPDRNGWDPDWDQAMVARCQSGDDAAFDLLYRRYHRRVERLCRMLLDGDAAAAEEAAQEALARAYRALPGLGGERHFYPWVRVIARRVCLDEHRRHRRERIRVSRLVAVAVDEAGGDPASDASADDAALAIAALGRLPARYRAVLRLRDIEGLTAHDAATHLDTTPGAVDVLLFRARRALRREFTELDGIHAGVGAMLLAAAHRVRVGVDRSRVAAERVAHRLCGWCPVIPWDVVGASVVTGALVVGVAPSPDARPPTAATAGHRFVVTTDGRSAGSTTTGVERTPRPAPIVPAAAPPAPRTPGPDTSPSVFPKRIGPLERTDYDAARQPPPDAQAVVIDVPWVGGAWVDPDAVVDYVRCKFSVPRLCPAAIARSM